MAIATLASLKTLIPVTGTNDDARMLAVIEEAQRLIEGYLDRTLSYPSADVVEYHDGGAMELYLKSWPVASIAIRISDDYAFDESDEIENTDYRVLDRGVVARLPLDTCWPAGRGQIRVTYRGGYLDDVIAAGGSAAPRKLQDALRLQARHLWKRNQDPGASTVGLAGGAGSFGYQREYELLDAVKQLLAGERRTAVCG